MQGSGAWQTGVADVRTMISDGSNDKMCYRKEFFGNIDGANTTYKTFERRRVTNFTTAVAPTGVYVNGVIQTVTTDDLESGEFVLQSAPAAGTVVRGTYYYQWFDDAEIQSFLTIAAEFITGADDWTVVANNLIQAAKAHAASWAYQKLVSKFSTNTAEQFQLYDAPDGKRFDPIKVWGEEADRLMKLSFELRDDAYKDRQGQAKAPIWSTLRGRTRDVAPNR